MVSLFIFSAPLLVIRGSPPGIRSGQRKRRGRSNSSSTRQTVSVLPIRPLAADERAAAAWLSAISGMSEDQRREAMVALEKASVVGGAAAASAKKGGKRGRQEDGLGTTGVERVAAQGCPHCAGREIVGWGRSHGLLRFRCKSCGRTFNTLTKTPMAHLRKKDRWLDHARAMIEGKSLAKTAALCGIHPTTAFRWRHRFLRAPASDKPRGLRGIVEADETFVLESFKGRRSDLPRKARRRGGTARHPGLHQDNIPILVARDRNGATFDAILARSTALR